jgi:peptidoglycan/LPS O-acetylase OafA/YrhL
LNDVQFRVLAFIGCLILGGLIGIVSTHNAGATTALAWIIGLPLYFFVAKPLLRALDRGEDRLLDWLTGNRDPKDWD